MEEVDVDRVQEVKKRFLELHGVLSIHDFITGWFHGAPYEQIYRGNVLDFVAYGFYSKRPQDLSPKVRLLHKMVSTTPCCVYYMIKSATSSCVYYMIKSAAPCCVYYIMESTAPCCVYYKMFDNLVDTEMVQDAALHCQSCVCISWSGVSIRSPVNEKPVHTFV